MSKHIKTWTERMPKPRVEYQCSMNCSPRSPGRACGDCTPVKVYGDPIAARDAEIAELRAELATRCRAEGGNTNQVGCERDDGLLNIHAESETCEVCSAPAAGTDKDAELSSELQEIHRFLLGEGQLEGVNFGEWHSLAIGEWWWRKRLRAAIAAHTSAGEAPCGS